MRTICIIILFSLSIINITAQSYWAKSITTTFDNDESYRTKNFVDGSGNLYFLNHLKTASSLNNMVSVTKIDSTGQLLWTYLYTSAAPNIGEVFMIKSKGDLPVLLINNNFAWNISSTTLVELDRQGNVIHCKSSKINDVAWVNGIITTSDSGFLAYGSLRKNTKWWATYVVKYDSLFNCEWTSSHRIKYDITFARCAFEINKNYFIGGLYSLYMDAYFGRPYILKLNKKGKAVAAKIISSEINSECWGITKLKNGNLFSFSYCANSDKAVFTAIDQSLNIISQKESSFHIDPFYMIASDSLIFIDLMDNTIYKRRAIIFDKSGNFLLGIDNGNKDIDEIIPSNGSSFFMRSWPGWDLNYFDIYKMDTTMNSTSCISKFYQFNLVPTILFDTIVPISQYHPQLVDTFFNISQSSNTLTSNDFCLALSVHENSIHDFSFYPNPATNTLTIFHNQNKQLSVFTLMGEVIIENHEQMTDDKIVLDISFLPSGIYLIKSGNIFKKFIKL